MRRAVKTVIDSHLCLRMDHLSKGAAMKLRSQYTRSNPKYFKQESMGFWAGNVPKEIRSWSIDENWLLLPRGNRVEVEASLAVLGYHLDPVIDRTVVHKSLGLRLQGKLRPEQGEAAQALVEAGIGTIRGPCGSGKTVMLLGAIALADQPAIVVVPTRVLLQQWYDAVVHWLHVTPGVVGGGKEEIKPITIALQQTVWRRPDAPWLRSFGTLVGDECHKWGSKTHVMCSTMFPTRYRFGASADERRKDGLEFLIYETFGPPVNKLTREDMVKKGRLLPIRMEFLPTEFEDEDFMAARDEGMIPDWGAMITALCDDEERNRLIWDQIQIILSSDPNHRVLLLTERVAAAEEWVSVATSNGYPAGLMIGGSENKDELQASIAGLRNGAIRFGAGTRVADEGLDIPGLTHVVISCPMHQHPKRLEQMVGRAARKHPGKRMGHALYVWDQRMFPKIGIENPKIVQRRMKRFFEQVAAPCAEWEVQGNFLI